MVEEAHISAPSPVLPGTESPTERRLRAEWKMLCDMVALNPTRLRKPEAKGMSFHVTLAGTPAPLAAASGQPSEELAEHALRVQFPRDFPAVPLELYLQQPVFHPNVHPETGFVCLWHTHRTAHNTEHALHKVAAILGWQLANLAPEHVMQEGAAAVFTDRRQQLADRLTAPTLKGLDHSEFAWQEATAPARRRRLECC